MPKRVFKQKGSRVYRLRYRVDGDSREYDVPLKTTNKEVAEAKARVIVEEKEKELAGLLDPKPLRDAAKKPIAEHLADYVADLQARGNGKDHIVHTRQRMRRLIADCHWQLLHDVSADSFAKWLRGQQAQRSAKTLNEYLGHLKAFFNWLERQDRIAQNRIGRIPRLDARGKETFKRRPLEVEQFLLLIKYSEKRRFAYALAALTGLRRGELKRLLWADVHLDAPRPWMEIRGATTKNKQPATIFPVPLLIELLKAHWGDGTGLVLPDGVPSVATLTKDLTACGIPVHDERGWRVDFHALRHTFASLLDVAKVYEGDRVRMVRHSSWKQTDHYTGPNSNALYDGMQKLALLLPSSLASLNSGNTSPNEGNVVQSGIPHEKVESPDFRGETPVLSKAVPTWESLEVVPPRGIEPRFED